MGYEGHVIHLSQHHNIYVYPYPYQFKYVGPENMAGNTNKSVSTKNVNPCVKFSSKIDISLFKPHSVIHLQQLEDDNYEKREKKNMFWIRMLSPKGY
jgi:hypothetical protein